LCGDNLVIIGSGDPLLGDKNTDDKYGRQAGWIFDNIAAALKQNNRTTIGDIIVDSSVFDSQRTNPNWPKEELNRWYACEISGLNFNDNCIEITAKIIGGKAVVSIEPATNYVEITNKVVPISTGRNTVGSYRTPEINKIVVHGKCRDTAGPFDVAIEKPAEFFGFLLKENLTKAGINVNGQVIEKTEAENCNLKILTEFKTPIADCLARSNKNSLELAAESLLKTVAANASPDKRNGGWAKGKEIISQYLLGLGIDKSEFYIDDGCGLSKENKFSANAITKVLLSLYKDKNWQLYKDSLAVGGVDGTIGKYFKEGKYKGRIFGKTGYINNVKSFSGICCTDGGDYIFSILANNADDRTRDVLNDIAKAIIDEFDTAKSKI
jgi:D-alanyl-D-alanine carboxypeptidase/D-alanyl-D-alanine-endopeptidase (penicillin-binding protein 4)